MLITSEFINGVINMFTKKERSTFKYWFAHWCAFQLVALVLRSWKPGYLLHDIEKPWLRLWYRGDYSKVQKWHRTHRRHHLEYPGRKDYIALVIDWECGRYTKDSSPRTAYQEYEVVKSDLSEEDAAGIMDALCSLGLFKGGKEIKLREV